jgi:hypothetical protein
MQEYSFVQEQLEVFAEEKEDRAQGGDMQKDEKKYHIFAHGQAVSVKQSLEKKQMAGAAYGEEFGETLDNSK